MKDIIVRYKNNVVLKEYFANRYKDKEIVETILNESSMIPVSIIKVLSQKKQRILFKEK